MTSHSIVKPYACERCPKTFKQKTALNYHTNIHDGIKQLKQFTCDECGQDFCTKVALEHHMNIHTGLTPFSCSFCGKQYRHPITLASHEKKHKDGTLFEKVYVRNIHCDQCDKSYCGKRGLRRHKAEVHSQDNQIKINNIEI